MSSGCTELVKKIESYEPVRRNLLADAGRAYDTIQMFNDKEQAINVSGVCGGPLQCDIQRTMDNGRHDNHINDNHNNSREEQTSN